MSYGIDLTDDNLQRPLVSLQVLYNQMPETSGCEKCAEINGKDNEHWCCRFQHPSMYYSEFLKAYKTTKEWSRSKREDLILRALRNYLDNSLEKGCIFYNDGCQVYKQRPFVCFVKDTIILTKEGPRYIQNIFAGDQVMTHQGNYKKVLRTTSSLHSQGLIRIVTKSDLGVTCTPDHRFYVVSSKDKRSDFTPKLYWCGAEFLQDKKTHQGGHYTCFPKIRFGSGMSQIAVDEYSPCVYLEEDRVLSITYSNSPPNRTPSSIPQYFDVNTEFLWMLGLYLAEGSCSNSGAIFSLHRDEQVTFGKRLAGYFDSVNISWSERELKRNGYSFFVNSSIFAKFIKTLCGCLAYNKALHPSLFGLSSVQLLEIFYGWRDGDGTKEPASGCTWKVTTTSRMLLYQMYFILMANKLHPFLGSERRPNREHTNYTLSVYDADFKTKPGQGNCYKIENDLTFFPLKTNKSIPHDENVCVFDLQVEDDESFVTSGGIVHNCRMYGVIPEKSWQERWDLLKKRQGDDFQARPQCSLVASEREITPDLEDKWFLHTKKCESRIGVPKDSISLHDEAGGSYRSFHDHLLLQLFGEDVLSNLTKFRLSNPSKDDIESTIEILRELINE